MEAFLLQTEMNAAKTLKWLDPGKCGTHFSSFIQKSFADIETLADGSYFDRVFLFRVFQAQFCCRPAIFWYTSPFQNEVARKVNLKLIKFGRSSCDENKILSLIRVEAIITDSANTIA